MIRWESARLIERAVIKKPGGLGFLGLVEAQQRVALEGCGLAVARGECEQMDGSTRRGRAKVCFRGCGGLKLARQGMVQHPAHIC